MSTTDPAHALRTRMRADLRTAMRARDREAVAALRSGLAAVDNAEAVAPAPTAGGSDVIAGASVGVGSAEVGRRVLTAAELRAVVEAEVAERVDAAGAYASRPERAEALLREAEVLRGYLT